MYCEAFNLREKPFSLAADPRYLYMSQQHWEAMAHLMYGVEDDWGFVLITGEIGTGKTTLCRLLLDQMPSDVEFAFLMNPMLTVQELLASICDEFRIKHPPAEAGTRELFDLISAHLLDIYARAHKALLIIDEAQYLSPDVIDQLRLLTNLETADGKLLRIILIGQPELRDKLAQPELEQMSQRITARYHLGPLSRKDVSAYVSHRMTLAGAQEQLFTTSAARALFRLSRGVPRLINVICDRALLGACLKNEKSVTRATLVKAAGEIFRKTEFSRVPRSLYNIRWAAAGLALGLLVSLLFLKGRDLPAAKADLMPQSAVSNVPAVEVTRTKDASAVPWWPKGKKAESSVSDASYRALVESKGYSYFSTGSMAASMFCSDIELLHLRCADKREPGLDLRAVPVPALLALSDAKENNLSVALLALQADKAKLRINNNDIEVPAAELRSLWTGDYTILEQMPKSDIQEKKAGSKKVVIRRKGQ